MQINLRKINPWADMKETSDLIELCFQPWLDINAKRYLSSIRASAERTQRYPILKHFSEPPFFQNGVVSVNNTGQIIGCVTMSRVFAENQSALFLSNVCVHPDFRHQGIARKMMEYCLNEASYFGNRNVYLQVREETQDAVHMYLDLDFNITDRRNVYFASPSHSDGSYRLSAVKRTEISDFRQAFRQTYPDTVIWNLGIDESIFSQKFLDRFENFLFGYRFQTISDTQNKINGWMALQRMEMSEDKLWLIPAPNADFDLLYAAVSDAAVKKTLVLNLPKDFPVPPFRQGDHQIWMKK